MAISEEAKSLAAFEPSAFGAIHAELQATFSSGKTKAIAWRKWQLKQFWWMVEDNEQAILDALAADLGRHEMEGRAADLLGLKSDILEHLGHVDEWAATTRVADAGLLFGGLGRARLRKEPVGVVLVIGAWNFPFLLTLQPVIAAIAAGCCVVMKPSELAPASERVMADLVHRYLDRSAVRLVRGGPEETTAVLQRRFDHIFFTGSSTIARFVTAAAARHLTPTTLELGGQCPAIVAQTADVDLAARRIAYAKFLNAGQICLSVNHVLVHPAVHHAFLARLEHWTRTFAASGHMCRIISDRHYDRLARILDSTQGTVIRTAESSREERRLASAIVSNVTMSDPVMSEELFGPICPVLKTDTVDAIAAVNSLPRPLGLYIFSADKAEIETIQNQTLSGGVTINDATMHAGCPGAPFGGVGESGMGYYHGKYGFLAFTHLRTVVELPTYLDRVLSFRYPPYNTRNKSYVAVKNTLGFRRGETMHDQKSGTSWGLVSLFRRGVVLAGMVGCVLYWLDDIQTAKLVVHVFLLEQIPPHVGIGSHRHLVQARTLVVWLTLAGIGVTTFYQGHVNLDVRIRAAGLSLAFPGAGYIASANPMGLVAFILTWALVPFTLLAWFGAGALSVPLLLWAGSIPGAYLATGDRIWPKAGVVAAALLLVLFLYANRTAAASRRHGIEQRTARNAMIESSLGDIDARFTAASSRGGGRELDLATLRHLQHSFDMALQPPSDWSWFTRIDQFQTSALRYQVYEIMYALGTYQGIYAPNAHAYVSEAFRRIIARSLTPDVLGFWKWESLLGRFSADFDPVLHDNIMVTGFLLQGLMLYTANTGDERYCRKNSVRFQVTSDRTYAYDLHSIRDSVLRQWQASPFCLFACEPNWIYTPCNFQGLTGSRLYDRYFGSSGTDVLMPVFEESLCRNFSETNGSILPIRSELTGFTIPGLCGALGDLTVVMFARGTINHLSRRFWAIFLGEKVVFDRETGQLSLTGLVGADKMDAGNYTPSDYAIYPHLAQAAGEYGDKDLRAAALKKCYDGFGQITTPTGATCLDPAKASTATNLSVLRAELMQGGDWRDLITKGPPPTALSGPILSHAPYPGVLIAKAYSNDSVDLDMVLYPSGDSGTFSLTVSRLQPGKTYSFPTETTVADEMGDATFSVLVNGRTHVHLVLTDAEDTE